MSDRNAVMEAAFDEAQIAQEAEEFRKGEIHQESVEIKTGDEGITEQTDTLTSSARGKPMWNRETGVPSFILTDQAKLRIAQRFPDDHPNPEFRGQRVYTQTPMQPLNPGSMVCKLHKDHPDREYMDKWFRGQYCAKSNMRTQLDVENHFKSKHKGEHQVVEDYEKREHEKQVLEMQRLQMESMQALAGKNEVLPESLPEEPKTEMLEPCPEEGCSYQGTKQQLAGHKMGAHKREAQPAS